MPKMLRRRWKKAKKTKNSTKVKRRTGRPKRERSFSIPSALTEDQIANNVNSKRNIDEVGSPEKTETKLEEKKGRRREKGRRRKKIKKEIRGRGQAFKSFEKNI